MTAFTEAGEQTPSLKDLCFSDVARHHWDSNPTIPFFHAQQSFG